MDIAELEDDYVPADPQMPQTPAPLTREQVKVENAKAAKEKELKLKKKSGGGDAKAGGKGKPPAKGAGRKPNLA